jgi:hypothetical protein
MDPVAFFDHLAATSQSSHEDETEECATRERSLSNEKLLLNSRSLETLKAVKRDKEEDNKHQAQQNIHQIWNNLVESYKLEKEGSIFKYKQNTRKTHIMIALSQQLRDQLTALEEVDTYFDKANINLYVKLENSYNEISKAISSHRQSLDTEKMQFEKEKELIKGI